MLLVINNHKMFWLDKILQLKRLKNDEMKQYILIVWNTLCKYEAEFHKRCDVLIKSNSVDE
jgi:hypothetical protein